MIIRSQKYRRRQFRENHLDTAMPLDPFEGRIQFLEQLKHLSASQSSSLKLAQFALKNRTLHEDLYSCIIEKLPSTSLNDKVNIFYFLGTLVDQSERAQFRPYGEMFRRDLDRIVSDVAPVDGGAVNIPPAKKVLKDLLDKRLISSALYSSAMSILNDREPKSSEVDTSKDYFSQDEIRRRMEEDRERHKILREGIWMIPKDRGPDAEFDMMWETTSSFGEDDIEYMHEENAKKQSQLRF